MNSPKPYPGATSAIILSNTPASNPSETSAKKRPLYAWVSAAVAVLVAALFGLLALWIGGLPRNVASLDGLASVFTLAIPPFALAAAAGVVLIRAWGKTLLAVTGFLLLTIVGIGILHMFTVMSAGYSSGFAIRLMSGFLVALVSFFPALAIWLAYLAMRRQSNTLAFAALAVMGVLLLLAARMFGFL